MTVDQILLPFTPIRPLPPPSPAVDHNLDCDRFGAHAPTVTRPPEHEPPSGPSGWPRIFPGL